MSHGRRDNGWLHVTATAELAFDCSDEGLHCPECGQSDSFEIDIDGTATINSDGDVDFSITPAGGPANAMCNNCDAIVDLQQITGNDQQKLCELCNLIRKRNDFVHSITGKFCCTKCVHILDTAYFAGVTPMQ